MALEIWKPPAGLNYAGSKAKPPEGEGWQITGYNPVRIAMNPNRMGSGFRTEQVPIYGRSAPAPQQQAAPAQQQQAPTVAAPTQLPVKTYEPPPGPKMEDIAAQFSSQIAAMQQGFQQSMQQQATQFQQMQAAQQDRMADLQQQMMMAQVASADRPTVAGVKTATSSSGTDMQIARRGVRGALGRTGMRIKNLNV